MRFELATCVVRPPVPADAASLARHADDREVWINLRDGFPHPYRLADAEEFIARVTASDPVTVFVICVEDEAVGAIGYQLQTDVERVSAEIGYWLGARFWGRGIMSEVLPAVTRHAMAAHGLTRVYATPFEWNAASCRVLEKAGYVLEARCRRAALKDGRLIDKYLYARVAPEEGAAGKDPS